LRHLGLRNFDYFWQFIVKHSALCLFVAEHGGILCSMLLVT